MMLLFLLLLLLLLCYCYCYCYCSSFSCCSDSDYAVLSCLPGAPSAPGCLAASVVRPDSDRQLLAHPPVSAEPLARFRAVATVRCVKTPGLQRRSGRAASVAPWPALLASRQRPPGCKAQRRFAHALFVVAAVPARCCIRCHTPV